MSNVTKRALYGYSFEVPNKYAEGHPLTAIEAQKLNEMRSEFISHIMRRMLVEKHGMEKGSVIAEGSEAEADLKAKLAELIETYEFSMGGGGGGGASAMDPVEKEARAIARSRLRAKVKESGQFPNGIGKADGSQDNEEGFYPYARYAEKLEALVEHPEIVKYAKAEVARKSKAAEKVDDLFSDL